VAIWTAPQTYAASPGNHSTGTAKPRGRLTPTAGRCLHPEGMPADGGAPGRETVVSASVLAPQVQRLQGLHRRLSLLVLTLPPSRGQTDPGCGEIHDWLCSSTTTRDQRPARLVSRAAVGESRRDRTRRGYPRPRSRLNKRRARYGRPLRSERRGRNIKPGRAASVYGSRLLATAAPPSTCFFLKWHSACAPRERSVADD
jgi:hypothetical protein